MEEKQIVSQAKALGLTGEEYLKIEAILGRTPNFTEICIFSAMWSEHCSYKNSIKWLKTLPKEGPATLVAAGEENAGLIDIGEGLACCFKIESHNHPSAIEPFQGAATGVGGINRDIFSMGARPIAQLNSLRFGNIKNERTKWLVEGVVKGIGTYGNSFGIPTVGGEVYFDDCYQTNILVNAMSVGLVKVGESVSATAEGINNPVYIYGSSTGKDGIHGASFASKDISEDSVNDLPSVQVGDPFWEKLLLEATLEIIQTKKIVGIQDMGAAGITCSTSEMSAKAGVGIHIDLDKVPLRQSGMKDWEILISESQERMLVVVEKGHEKEIEAILDKWDITYAQIGKVTDTKNVEFYQKGMLKASIPSESLVLGGGAPVYERKFREPSYFEKISSFDDKKINCPKDLISVAKFLLAQPNIASKNWISKQYDSMVGTITQTTEMKSDAAIVKLENSEKSLAMTVDCNSRYVFANPKIGGSIAVAEAARNIVCSGGKPLAITNCLNFGNPYNEEVYYQFVHAIKGITVACEALETPVTGGNVSFYNQSTSDGKSVYPTPTIGMVGLIEKQSHITSMSLQKVDDVLYLLGPMSEDFNSSQYLAKYHHVEYSPAPSFQLSEEVNLQHSLLQAIRNGWISSAHDLSEGGLFCALAESCFQHEIGCQITLNSKVRMDALLFGEAQSRVLISVAEDKANYIEEHFHSHNVQYTKLGCTVGDELKINDHNFGTISALKKIYSGSIAKELSND